LHSERRLAPFISYEGYALQSTARQVIISEALKGSTEIGGPFHEVQVWFQAPHDL
jgi:hypothetical protein